MSSGKPCSVQAHPTALLLVCLLFCCANLLLRFCNRPSRGDRENGGTLLVRAQRLMKWEDLSNDSPGYGCMMCKHERKISGCCQYPGAMYSGELMRQEASPVNSRAHHQRLLPRSLLCRLCRKDERNYCRDVAVHYRLKHHNSTKTSACSAIIDIRPEHFELRDP